MMRQPWFKAIIWFLSTAFFFLASAVIISAFGPGPSEQQVMLFMSGMMDAMHNSLMGLSMTLESDPQMKALIYAASSIALPLILLSIVLGFYVRFLKDKNNVS